MKRNFGAMYIIFQNILRALEKQSNIRDTDIIDIHNSDEIHNFNLMVDNNFFRNWIDPETRVMFFTGLTGKGERFYHITKNKDLLYALENKYHENLPILSLDTILEQAEWFIQHDNFFLLGDQLSENGHKLSYQEYYDSILEPFDNKNKF